MAKEICLLEASNKKIEQVELLFIPEDEVDRVEEEYFEPFKGLMPFYYLKDGRRCLRIITAEDIGLMIPKE